jgi:hypothetical protein
LGETLSQTHSNHLNINRRLPATPSFRLGIHKLSKLKTSSAGPSSNILSLPHPLLTKVPQLRRSQPSTRARATPCHLSVP